jgi:hypothetical protein
LITVTASYHIVLEQSLLYTDTSIQVSHGDLRLTIRTEDSLTRYSMMYSRIVLLAVFGVSASTRRICTTTTAFVPPLVTTTCNNVRRSHAFRQGATSALCAAASEASSNSDDDQNDEEEKTEEWTSDFDDFVGSDSAVFFDPNNIVADKSSTSDSNSDNSDKLLRQDSGNSLDRIIMDQDEVEKDDSLLAASFSKALQKQQQTVIDKSACRTRQFSLGADFILTNYVGSLGFDEVTDWEYYLSTQDEDGNTIQDDRQVVQPNPFDKSQPRRTRSSSGSVVRIFRGEFVGPLGGSLSANGLDRRLLIKEFSGGDLAFALAQAELETLAKLQSSAEFFPNNNDNIKDDWIGPASARSVRARQDNANVLYLVDKLRTAPFTGLLGEVNLAELQDDLDPNDFYRSLGVAPPTLSSSNDGKDSSNAIWLVYEYAGLQSLQAYCLQPPSQRRANLPRQKGFFGNVVEPPPLPSFESRSQYVVRGILKGCIEALATLHDAGIVHRSIGRSSLILSNSKTLDKAAASSPFATLGNTVGLQVKLTDFGFSGPQQDSTLNEEFRNRARSYKLYFQKGENSILTTNFAIAEDMHALGFVFLGLVLTALADVPQSWNPKEQAVLPATDEDSLQRLLGEIFNKDVKGQFRDYVEAEECWTNVVALLDDKNGAGWTVLETLICAREKVAANRDATQILSIRGLLSNPFFN